MKEKKPMEVKGKTWNDLVREVFPDATDEQADYILWEHTGFPGFWNIPNEGNTPEECCRQQLYNLRERVIEEQRARDIRNGNSD